MRTGSHAGALLLSMLVPAISIAGAASVALAIGPGSPATTRADVPVTRRMHSPPRLLISEGRTRYVQSCAHCHGDDAKGSGEDADGPDLHALRLSDARIATIIRRGIRGEMPAFAKKYSADDTATLVAYLRTLR